MENQFSLKQDGAAARSSSDDARRRLLLGMLATLSTFLGCGRKRESEPKTVDLYIASDGDFLQFKPDELTCPTGATVRLTFHHAGRILTTRHNWVLTHSSQLEALTKDAEDKDGILPPGDPRVIAATPLCDKGMSVMVQFVAPPPGDYPFVCSTHPEDMNGILHVTK
jgi:azurin